MACSKSLRRNLPLIRGKVSHSLDKPMRVCSLKNQGPAFIKRFRITPSNHPHQVWLAVKYSKRLESYLRGFLHRLSPPSRSFPLRVNDITVIQIGAKWNYRWCLVLCCEYPRHSKYWLRKTFICECMMFVCMLWVIWQRHRHKTYRQLGL